MVRDARVVKRHLTMLLLKVDRTRRRGDAKPTESALLLSTGTVKNLGNYSAIRDTITELVRKKIALQYRIERLNHQVSLLTPAWVLQICKTGILRGRNCFRLLNISRSLVKVNAKWNHQLESSPKLNMRERRG